MQFQFKFITNSNEWAAVRRQRRRQRVTICAEPVERTVAPSASATPAAARRRAPACLGSIHASVAAGLGAQGQRHRVHVRDAAQLHWERLPAAARREVAGHDERDGGRGHHRRQTPPSFHCSDRRVP